MRILIAAAEFVALNHDRGRLQSVDDRLQQTQRLLGEYFGFVAAGVQQVVPAVGKDDGRSHGMQRHAG